MIKHYCLDCQPAAPSPQYPGQGGDIGTSTSIHSGTLPFSGSELFLYILLAAILLVVGYLIRKGPSGPFKDWRW